MKGGAGGIFGEGEERKQGGLGLLFSGLKSFMP
jgi:hypothetical protein